jgi:hypothetical protein
VKHSRRLGRVKVSADGEGVVSHAGAELLREMAGYTGMIDAWDAALIDTYKGIPIHFPGSVLADLAVEIADGGDCISDLRALRDQPQLFGAVASTPTAWRVLDRVSEAHLGAIRQGRAIARENAWKAGAGPDLSRPLFIDVDATIVIAHSEKENAAATWKRTFGFHPLGAFLDRPEIASGEALAGLMRPGNAGSNTAADHVELLEMSLASLPEPARPSKGDLSSPDYTVRSDSAGATHVFANFCHEKGLGFSFGFPITAEVREAIVALGEDHVWEEATEQDNEVRDGAWVAEITEHLDLRCWPKGSRVIVRKERPHPGAQLSLFDVEAGFRHTAFICAPRPEAPRDPRPIAELELEHRQHARVEDRIRQAKATGLRNLPSKKMPENKAWFECLLAAVDLICWSKLICFKDAPELAKCEIATFRYRILHMAARIARSGRVVYLRLDRTWRWAKALALAFTRLRAAFA